MVPGVRHALSVDAEHASGQSINLSRTSLDVVLSVVLWRKATTETTLEAVLQKPLGKWPYLNVLCRNVN